jgi:putative two-component system response regulator
MDVSSALEPAQWTGSVLVVDDERAVRDLIAEILARAGHRVLTAQSASEAIEIVESEQIEVVLTDVNMPGSISGLELIEELHARKPSLPIIPVTGAADEANLQEALDRGAAGFITKPFKAAELRLKVSGAINRLSLVEGELRERLLTPTVASILANAIEVRDEGMEGHTERLAGLALEVGRELGLPDRELEMLELGAVLHDVGKIGIPDRILMKPGPLTRDEREVMETHAVIGDRMLAPLEPLAAVRSIVRHHHERWDGAGYPDRLAGDEIPLLARIVAIADSVEAMSGERPYRDPKNAHEVVAELEQGLGRQWDPALVAIVLTLISEQRLRFRATGMSLLSIS